MKIKLVSSVTCPFVQRAVILLNEKQVPYEVDYIDLTQKPDWFLKISPRGKVPLLLVEGETLFESQAICEFLDETTGAERLISENPVLRARDRGWFGAIAEDLFVPTYKIQYGSDRDRVDKALGDLKSALSRLELEMKGRLYLTGDGTQFGIADVAIAPFFYRAAYFKKKGWIDLLEEMGCLQDLSRRILQRESVQHSVRDDFEEASQTTMQSQDAVLLR